MKLFTVILIILYSCLINGQLLLPGRSVYQDDPVVSPTYQYGPPVTNTRTILRVSAVPRRQEVTTSRSEVTNLRVVPLARPLPVPPPSEPPLYNYEPPKQEGGPYSFKYSADHGDGATSNREESSDGNGVVRGSYSYVDSDGLYRQVDYIADESGYRATIKTNEPGTERGGNQGTDPAGTTWEIAPPPEAVVARYANVDALEGRRVGGGSRVSGGSRVGVQGRRRVYSGQPVGGVGAYGSQPVGGVGAYGSQPVDGVGADVGVSNYGAPEGGVPVTRSSGGAVYRSGEVPFYETYGPTVSRRTNYNNY